MPPLPLRARTGPVPLARTNRPIREPCMGNLHTASAPSPPRPASPPFAHAPSVVVQDTAAFFDEQHAAGASPVGIRAAAQPRRLGRRVNLPRPIP
jgi:hypothetical protein